MQAQSRFSVSGGEGSSSSVSADEQEALIRVLSRGLELTAQLQAETPHALRGQGQAEDTAACILQEMSRAFTVCLSIMSSPARAPPPLPHPEMPAAEPGRRPREENVPRREIVTYEPNSDDGYRWKKYGQKNISNTSFPRCYYRCGYHRERGCPVTKQVQQLSNGDPPPYVVVYFNEHTCDTAVWEPKAAADGATTTNPLRDLPAGLTTMARQQGGLLGERGVKEEQERQALVSSLACVLGAQVSPAGSSSGSFFGQEPPPQQQGAHPSASVVDPNGGGGGELPRLDHVDAGLDVMDYDVTGELYFGESYGLPGDDGLPF